MKDRDLSPPATRQRTSNTRRPGLRRVANTRTSNELTESLLSVISGITKLQPITRAPSLLTPPERRAGGYSHAASTVTPGRSPLGRTELRPVLLFALRQQCAGVRRYSRWLRRAELGGLHGSHGTGTAGQAARRRAGVRGVQRADPGTSGRAAGRGRWCRGGAPSRACAAREEADRGGAAGDVRARGADADRHWSS